MKAAFRLSLVLSVLFASWCVGAVDIPYLTGRVTDNAGILSDDARKAITQRLKDHEDKTTNQIAVLTVPTLDGTGIEEYAVSVFKVWKLGQKGKDNGILVVVAPNDRRMRIEVGYGLESVITDGIAGSIIRNVMTPNFKSGDYNKGIKDGVGALTNILEGGKAPDVQEKTASPASGKSSLSNFDEPDMTLTERILIGAFIFGIIGLFTVIGILTPGMGWFLYFFLIPFWAVFPIMVVGTTTTLYIFIAYVVLYPLLKLLFSKSGWYTKAAQALRTKGRASIGGFTFSSGGSGSSGSSWSSGSSGSGFSGGGGSSGGGGASGSW